MRSYWIYLVYGEGGWYSELPEGRHPDLPNIDLQKLKNGFELTGVGDKIPISEN